jgi:Tol biopolymer transport system component
MLQSLLKNCKASLTLVSGYRAKSTPRSKYKWAEQIISSTGWELDPQYSPDGSRIVFGSNRSGFVEIMACDSDGSNPIPLTSFKGVRTAGAPRWSPDGRWIAFDSLDRFGPSGRAIFIVDAQLAGPAC